jgi:hypothetical protein
LSLFREIDLLIGAAAGGEAKTWFAGGMNLFSHASGLAIDARIYIVLARAFALAKNFQRQNCILRSLNY